MRRREFIIGIGGAAAAWPFAADAQQPTPVVGYLGATSRDKDMRVLGSLRDGLKEMGFIEGQNVAFEYRWAEGQYDRLPGLAAELVGQRVAVIFAPASTPAALAAKKATSTIPIVFTVGSDPVVAGLVNSLSRPSGNLTGVSILVNLLSAKRLELLKTLLPKATGIEALMNPKSANAWPDLNEPGRRRERSGWNSPSGKPAARANSTPPSRTSTGNAMARSSCSPMDSFAISPSNS
jgi:putative ABC transport system substrate-binding protein